MEPKKSPEELLEIIRREDKRFRTSLAIFMSAIGGVLILVLALQYQALTGFQSQSDERAAGIKSLQEQVKSESQKSNRYLRCIALFFAQTDRANATIKDIDSCDINLETGEPIVSPEDTKQVEDNDPVVNPTPDNPNGNEQTPPPATDRNVIQKNLTDPLFKGLNDIRGAIGL